MEGSGKKGGKRNSQNVRRTGRVRSHRGQSHEELQGRTRENQRGLARTLRGDGELGEGHSLTKGPQSAPDTIVLFQFSGYTFLTL